MFDRIRKKDRTPRGDPIDAGSTLVMLDEANFVEQTTGRFTLVDFWAPWCLPCHAFAPIFEAAAAQHGDTATFAKCNVDSSPGLAQRLGIHGIPTLVVFGPDGMELGRAVGALSTHQLDHILDDVARIASTQHPDGL